MSSMRFLCGMMLATGIVVFNGRASFAVDGEYGVRQGLWSVSGATSFSIQHEVDDPNDNTSTWNLSGAVGYFVTDAFSFDTIASLLGNFDGDHAELVHFAGTYHFLPRQRFTPYIQGGLGFIHADADVGPFSIDDTEGSYLVGGGLKYFVAHNISFNLNVQYTALFDPPDDGFMNYGLGFGLYF